MGNFSIEQKSAMQARSQWDKRKVWSKAVMDVVLNRGQDGEGAEYVTRYRIAMAAWNEFRGLGKAKYLDRRTLAFEEYIRFFDEVFKAGVRARLSSATQQPKLVKEQAPAIGRPAVKSVKLPANSPTERSRATAPTARPPSQPTVPQRDIHAIIRDIEDGAISEGPDFEVYEDGFSNRPMKSMTNADYVELYCAGRANAVRRRRRTS